MARIKVTTGCRDCALCTGHAFTGSGRQVVRGAAAVATLGVSSALTRKCNLCGHPMTEHAGGQKPTPAGWYQGVNDPPGDRRYWDGVAWGMLESEWHAQQAASTVEAEAVSAASATPPAGWIQDPDDATMLRWWTGDAWGEHRTPKA